MKRNIYIMYAMALLQGMVFYGPIATLYRQAQGVSVFQITAIESVSLFLCIILELPWGVLADRIGYKKTMVLCSWLYLLSKIVFWQAEGFGAFLVERIMLAVVIAGLSGVDSSILYLSSKDGKSQKVFGIYYGLGTVGLLTAAAVFARFVGENYRLAGFLTVISYALAAVLALFLKEVKGEQENKIDRKSFRHLLLSVLKDKKFLLFLLAIALFRESHQTITVFLNQLQYEKCGLNSSAIGYIYIVVTIVGLLGMFSHRVTAKLGTKNAAVLLFTGGAAACLCLALTGSALLSAGSIMLLRLSYMLFEPLHAELQNRQIESRYRATALSIYSMLINSVAVCTNLVFGSLAERSLPLAFSFGSLACVLGVILFMHWYSSVKA